MYKYYNNQIHVSYYHLTIMMKQQNVKYVVIIEEAYINFTGYLGLKIKEMHFCGNRYLLFAYLIIV